MSRTTAATQALSRAGIAFTLFPYDYDPDAPRIGLQAAEALGKDPAQVFKTLMAELDGKPVCVVVPSDGEVSMKKLAAVLGGISPFGQRRKVPTAIDETALLFDEVLINGGQRGLLLGLQPDDAIAVAEMAVADLMA